MSVLVKGMEMPQNCMMCQFHGFGGYKNELIVCSLTGRSEGQLSNVPDCPLVEIPPHGRLIDAEKLERDIEKYHLSDGKFQHWVQVQNSIIEAEEGEESDG